MSNSFTNWLSSAKSFDPTLGGTPILKDYQHAARLYVDDYYALSPKVGFLYFVSFNINRDALSPNDTWTNRDSQDFGLLVKRADLPKFKISTETLNQYNRKTVVQTKLNYESIKIDFHDDNADIVNNFWVNYYRHYYIDSNYGGSSNTDPIRNQLMPEFSDTKFGDVDYEYGRYNPVSTQNPFLYSIDIYVLHQKLFTQITLINPKITDWNHDSLNQAEGGKILQNSMTVAYENVLYNQGVIVDGENPEGFAALYYDKTPSPNSLTGKEGEIPQSVTRTSTFDTARGARTYGRMGGPSQQSIALYLANLLAQNYLNQKGIARTKGVGYNIAAGVFGALSKANAGKYSEPPPSENQPGIINLPGGVGINIFKGLNTSVDGKVRANPAALIFPKLGKGGP